MVITWYGEGCFKVQSGEFVILTDPFDAKSGLLPPRLKTDLVLKTLNPFPPIIKEEENWIVGAGEYNFKGVNVIGIPLNNESSESFLKTAYLVEIEGLKLCFLGHISENPEPAAMEHFIEEVDILVIPAGGKPFIEQKTAVKILKQIEPKIVIPSFFKIPGLKRPAGDLKIFLEEAGYKKSEPREKLTLKKKDLSEIKTTQMIVLKT